MQFVSLDVLVNTVSDQTRKATTATKNSAIEIATAHHESCHIRRKRFFQFKTELFNANILANYFNFLNKEMSKYVDVEML